MPQRPLICLTSKDAVVGLPEGWPQNRNDFIRFFNGNLAYTLDLIANYGNKRLAYRLATGDWAEIATAMPPQEFDLPLAEGFSSLGSEPSTYWKNQFGEVTVILQVKKNQPISDGEIAAYLPAGFSPSMQLRYPCLAPASRSTGFLYVDPNGGIAISFSDGAFPDVLASFTFLAAN